MENQTIPKFIENHLAEEETIEKIYYYPRRNFLFTYIWAIIFIFIGFNLSSLASFLSFVGKFVLILGFLELIFIEIQLRGTYFVITNKKVMRIFSFVTRNFVDLKFKDIKNVYCNQTVFDRLFNIGTISLSTAGTDGVEIKIGPILEYSKFYNLLDTKRNLDQ